MGGLGDVVFTLPSVNAVKAALPQARISFLTYREFAPLLEGFPHIDRVIELDRSRYRKLNPLTLITAGLTLLSELRQSEFDLTIDFQGFGETGWLCWWTRAPHRWGGVYRALRAWPYTRRVRRNPNLHPILYQLELLESAGGISPGRRLNQFVVPPGAAEQAAWLFSEWNLDLKRPTLFIQPFTNGEHKNWPLQGYLVLANHWIERGWQVVFGGGPGDRPALEPVRSKGYPVAAGAPLLLSAGLANLSTVVVGGDTGLLHLSVAMGKRVVMLINTTGPGDGVPFEHPEWTVVPPPGRSLSAIPPEAVINACVEALAESDSHWAERPDDMADPYLQA